MKDGDIMKLKLTFREARCLIRSLATANDAERTDPADQDCNTWLVQRLKVEIDRVGR